MGAFGGVLYGRGGGWGYRWKLDYIRTNSDGVRRGVDPETALLVYLLIQNKLANVLGNDNYNLGITPFSRSRLILRSKLLDRTEK